MKDKAITEETLFATEAGIRALKSLNPMTVGNLKVEMKSDFAEVEIYCYGGLSITFSGLDANSFPKVWDAIKANLCRLANHDN